MAFVQYKSITFLLFSIGIWSTIRASESYDCTAQVKCLTDCAYIYSHPANLLDLLMRDNNARGCANDCYKTVCEDPNHNNLDANWECFENSPTCLRGLMNTDAECIVPHMLDVLETYIEIIVERNSQTNQKVK